MADHDPLNARDAWHANARFWDQRMADGNDFFRVLVWPWSRAWAGFGWSPSVAICGKAFGVGARVRSGSRSAPPKALTPRDALSDHQSLFPVPGANET